MVRWKWNIMYCHFQGKLKIASFLGTRPKRILDLVPFRLASIGYVEEPVAWRILSQAQQKKRIFLKFNFNQFRTRNRLPEFWSLIFAKKIFLPALLGRLSFEKKNCEFSQLWSWPPPLKVVKPQFFFTPWPENHYVLNKKISPLKTQKNF